MGDRTVKPKTIRATSQDSAKPASPNAVMVPILPSITIAKGAGVAMTASSKPSRRSRLISSPATKIAICQSAIKTGAITA